MKIKPKITQNSIKVKYICLFFYLCIPIPVDHEGDHAEVATLDPANISTILTNGALKIPLGHEQKSNSKFGFK